MPYTIHTDRKLYKIVTRTSSIEFPCTKNRKNSWKDGLVKHSKSLLEKMNYRICNDHKFILLSRTRTLIILVYIAALHPLRICTHGKNVRCCTEPYLVVHMRDVLPQRKSKKDNPKSKCTVKISNGLKSSRVGYHDLQNWNGEIIDHISSIWTCSRGFWKWIWKTIIPGEYNFILRIISFGYRKLLIILINRFPNLPNDSQNQ